MNANPVNDIQTKYRFDRTKAQYLRNRKMILERMASGRFGGWIQAKAIRKTQSRWWKQRYNLGRYHREKKCKSSKKEAIEELKEMYGEENIISQIHADETTPHLHCDFVPLTKGEFHRRKDDRRQKKMRRTQEKFLKQCKKGCSRQICTFGADGESTI